MSLRQVRGYKAPPNTHLWRICAPPLHCRVCDAPIRLRSRPRGCIPWFVSWGLDCFLRLSRLAGRSSSVDLRNAWRRAPIIGLLRGRTARASGYVDAPKACRASASFEPVRLMMIGLGKASHPGQNDRSRMQKGIVVNEALAHRPENRNRFSESTMCRFNELERLLRVRLDARRSSECRLKRPSPLQRYARLVWDAHHPCVNGRNRISTMNAGKTA